MKDPLVAMDLSHHAYALVGGDDIHAELVKALEKKHKIKRAGNPDFFDRRYEVFAIDDARELKSLAETRPATPDGKKIFVLMMDGITVEAQNALLKLLEEPGEYAHFFLILPSAHLLIPTMKSRMRIVGSGASGGTGRVVYDMAPVNEFLAAPVAKRLDIIKKLMEEIAKEKKTKQDAIDFLNALEEAVHARAASGGEQALRKSAAGLEAILLAGKYATDRAPSMKMLLEYCAMIC